MVSAVQESILEAESCVIERVGFDDGITPSLRNHDCNFIVPGKLGDFSAVCVDNERLAQIQNLHEDRGRIAQARIIISAHSLTRRALAAPTAPCAGIHIRLSTMLMTLATP